MGPGEETPDKQRQTRSAWVLIAGLLSLSLARWLAEWHWLATCIWSWSLHASLIGLLLSLSTWRQRRLFAAAVLSVLLVLVGHLEAVPAVVPQQDHSQDRDPKIRLLSLNLGFWNENAEVLRRIEALDPDVIFLCEANLTIIDRLEATGRWPHHRWTGLETGAFGWALFARWPLTVEDCWVRGLSNPVATVAHPAGDLLVVGVHPPPPVRSEGLDRRTATLAALGDAMTRSDRAGLPCAVMGDFNAIRADPALVAFAARRGLRTCHPWIGTWPSPLHRLGLAIDHQFIDPACRLLDRGTQAFPGTDHLGLWIDLSWRTEP